MRILIVTSLTASFTYIPELVQALFGEGLRPSVLDINTMKLLYPNAQGVLLPPGDHTAIARLWRPIRSVYKLLALSHVLKKFPDKPWDAINVHYVLPAYALIRRSFRKAGRQLILTYWGSDFLRASRGNLFVQKWFHPVADAITFNNPAIANAFLKQFPSSKDKIRILRFGFRSLDSLDSMLSNNKEEAKKIFGIPADAICLALGYNASPAQNHSAMLEALSALDALDKSRMFLIIPATYPDDTDYVQTLRILLESTGCSGLVVENRLTMHDLCLLRLATDIAINIQKTDSFSASIQEHAYAGAALILGSWLPYDVLEDAGVKIFKVNNSQEITVAVTELLHGHLAAWRNGLEARQGIRDLSGWKENITSWITLYAGE
jgi:hypothetical protein